MPDDAVIPAEKLRIFTESVSRLMKELDIQGVTIVAEFDGGYQVVAVGTPFCTGLAATINKLLETEFICIGCGTVHDDPDDVNTLH